MVQDIYIYIHIYIIYIFEEFCVRGSMGKSVLYLPYSTGNTSEVLLLQYNLVRCEKCIVNSETEWHIPVNSAKISLLTEMLVQDIESSYQR